MIENDKAKLLYRKSIPNDVNLPKVEEVKGTSLTNDEIDANFRTLVIADSQKASINSPQFSGGVGLPQYYENSEGTVVPFGDNEVATEPVDGMLRWNMTSRRFEYYVEEYAEWLPMESLASGSKTDNIVYLNDQVINYSYAIPTGKNGMTAGPITVADGVTATVENNATWTIV